MAGCQVKLYGFLPETLGFHGLLPAFRRPIYVDVVVCEAFDHNLCPPGGNYATVSRE
jgi:hypothetical protein